MNRQPGNRRQRYVGALPLSYAGIFSRGRTRTCDHPLTRRSNPGLHHQPNCSFSDRRGTDEKSSGLIFPGTLRVGATPPSLELTAPARFATLLARLSEVTLLFHHRRNWLISGH